MRRGGSGRVGHPIQGEPPVAPILKAGKTIGYAYLNSDFTSSLGYSGKPIHIGLGIDPSGTVRGMMAKEQDWVVVFNLSGPDPRFLYRRSRHI